MHSGYDCMTMLLWLCCCDVSNHPTHPTLVPSRLECSSSANNTVTNPATISCFVSVWSSSSGHKEDTVGQLLRDLQDHATQPWPPVPVHDGRVGYRGLDRRQPAFGHPRKVCAQIHRVSAAEVHWRVCHVSNVQELQHSAIEGQRVSTVLRAVSGNNSNYPSTHTSIPNYLSSLAKIIAS